ncbi:MAG: hypothetical protein IKC31_08080 [Clostridia bacterium]|nr:hypothetical protein [Clostridia bacterium]
MKAFNKVLAVILAVITVVAMLPMSVFAQEWAKIEVENEGATSKLTLTVDADKLTEILTGNGVSEEGVKDILGSISFDQNDLFEIVSLEELFEIVSKETLMEHLKIDKLVNTLDAATVMGYIEDYAALLEGVDLTQLPGFIPEGTDLSTIFVFSLLMNYVGFEDAAKYLNDAALKELLNERLTDAAVVQKFVQDIGMDVLADVVFVGELLEDGVIVLNKDVISYEDVKSLVDFAAPDLASDLIEAGVFDLTGIEGFIQTLPNPEQYVDAVALMNSIQDYEALLEGCDLTKIPGFIPEGTDLSTIFVFSKLMEYVGFEDAAKYLDDGELKALINERLADESVIRKFVKDLSAKTLNEVVFIEDLLEDGVIVLNKDIVSLADVKSLVDFTTPNLANSLINAGVFDLTGLEGFFASLENAKDYVDPVKVKALININDYIGDFDYTSFDVDHSVFGSSDLDTSKLVAGDYTVGADLTVSLTEQGIAKIKANPTYYLTASGMQKLEAQVDIDDIYAQLDAGKLVEDLGMVALADCLYLDLAVAIEGIDAYINYAKLVNYIVSLSDGDYSVFLSNPDITINYDAIDWSGLQNAENITDYVDMAKIVDPEIVSRDILFEVAGGEGRLIACADTSAMFADSKLLQSVMTKINADPDTSLVDVVNVSNFINCVTDKVGLVALIGINKLIDELGINTLAGCLYLEQVVAIDGIDTYINYPKLVGYIVDLAGGYDAILSDPDITINYTEIDWSGLREVEDITLYFDMEKIVDPNVVPRSILFEAAGGEDRVLACVNTTAMFADSALLTKVITKVNNDPNVELTDVVNVANFVNCITDKAAFVEFIGMDKLMAQIDSEEITAIVQGAGDIFSYIEDKAAFAKMIINRLSWVVDEITVDGSVVASENPNTATLKVDPRALVDALIKVLPTLDDIAELEDGKLIDTTVGIKYQANEEAPVTEKNVQIEVVVVGDISKVQAAAEKLSNLIAKYIEFKKLGDGNVYLGIKLPDATTPEEFTVLYENALNTDLLSDELKLKLLGISHNGFEGFIDTLTLEDLVAILNAVDLEGLYEALTAISYVETVLEKLEAKTGLNVSDVTLDEFKDQLTSIPSAEHLCQSIQERTGRDIMAILEGAAEGFDGLAENEMVSQMLELVSARIGYDLSDISVSEILDRAANVSISEKIASVVSQRVGRDVLEILKTHTVEELRALAVEKISTKVDAFEKVRNYAKFLLGYLPEEIAKTGLSSLYLGDGNFGGSVTVTVDYKPALTKVIEKSAQLLELPIEKDLLDKIIARIPAGTVTFCVSASNIHVTNVYEITYKNREGNEVLFRAFMPVGADLSIFKHNLELVGYEFTGWSDADGNPVLTMPAGDTTVYADRAAAEISLYDTDGVTLLTKIYAYKGAVVSPELVATILDMVTLPEVNEHLHEDFHILWKYQNAQGAWVDGITLDSATFTADTALYAYAEPDHFLEVEDHEHEVTYEDGKYNVTVKKDLEEVDEATFRLSRDKVLKRFAQSTEYQSITLSFEKEGAAEEIGLFTLDRDILLQLYKATAEGDEVYINYATVNSASIVNPMYQNLDGASFFDFNFVVQHADQTENELSLGNFEGDLTVRLPYGNIVTNDATGNSKTFVYILTENGRERVEATFKNGLVEFVAPHFSSFVINTEYRVSQQFLFNHNNAAVPGNNYFAGLDEYYPKGTTLTLDPVFHSKYELARITASTGTLSADGKTLTTPASGEAVTLTAYLADAQAHIYYVVNGEIYKTITYRAGDNITLLDIADVIADETVSAPAGYTKTGAEWVGYDPSKLGVQDMYVFAEWKPIVYTILFTYGEDPTAPYSVQFTADNYQNIIVPEVPARPGMSGAWEEFDILEFLASGETTLTVKAVYTPVTYAVVVKYLYNGSDAVLQVAPGAIANIPAFTVLNYKTTATAVDAEGNEIEVTGWTFTMPESTVYVTVKYEPVSMSYTVNGVSGAAKYGDTITVEIPLAAGQTLTSISDICTFVGRAANESKETLTYQFVLLKDKTAVTYVIADVKAPILNIYNGNVHKNNHLAVNNDNAEFAGWASGVAGMNFATLKYHKTVSLLWLWIVLAIALVVFLIGWIYRMHTTGRMKPSFLTRFIVWLVTGIYKLCLGVESLVTKIVASCKKKQ